MRELGNYEKGACRIKENEEKFFIYISLLERKVKNMKLLSFKCRDRK